MQNRAPVGAGWRKVQAMLSAPKVRGAGADERQGNEPLLHFASEITPPLRGEAKAPDGGQREARGGEAHTLSATGSAFRCARCAPEPRSPSRLKRGGPLRQAAAHVHATQPLKRKANQIARNGSKTPRPGRLGQSVAQLHARAPQREQTTKSR